jgi:transcriptional regulator of arginine metabolism
VKLPRQAAILRLVRERRIGSQDELRAALASEGIDVAQATLSRDLRELGLAKVTDGGVTTYRPEGPDTAIRPGLGQLAPSLLVGLDGVGALLVVRTIAGGAGALAAAVDQAGWPEVIGTIAGDDTILVVTRGPREREAIAERIRSGSGVHPVP